MAVQRLDLAHAKAGCVRKRTGCSTCAGMRPSWPTSSSSTAGLLGWIAAGPLLGAAGRCARDPVATETFLDDVDSGFYCAAYLRAWALETPPAAATCTSVSGRLVRARRRRPTAVGLWGQGQRFTAEELLGELTGERRSSTSQWPAR